MGWLQLSLALHELDPDAVSTFFEERGALSITFLDGADQPIFEPDIGTTPLWPSTIITAMYEENVDVSRLRAQLQEVFDAAVVDRLTQETVQDQDWERVWLDRFEPMQFGEHLWVCPAGQRPDTDDNAVIIDLDPGLAFGTGTHPTTALCLQWLDQNRAENQQVLDYGCGSGILSIAALKLGASSVWGIDIDEQALWASVENAKRNHVADRLHTGLPADQPAQKFDLLLANILANPLIELAPALASRLRTGAQLVLSGILTEQSQEVMAAYQPWCDMDEPVVLDGWVRISGTKRA